MLAIRDRHGSAGLGGADDRRRLVRDALYGACYLLSAWARASRLPSARAGAPELAQRSLAPFASRRHLIGALWCRTS